MTSRSTPGPNGAPKPAHRRIALAALVLLWSCAAPPPPAVAPLPIAPAATAESLLAEALRAYEEARYPLAQRGLRDALEAGLRQRADRVTAHKVLGFIYCASKQDALCRDAFKRALEIDPSFTLAPGEAGHPLWGPVFRQVKAKVSG